MKYLSITILLIIVLSIFSVVMVIAPGTTDATNAKAVASTTPKLTPDVTVTTTTVTGESESVVESTGEVEEVDLTETENVEVLEEYESVLPSETATGMSRKVPGVKRSTSARGWAIKDDDSDAVFVSGLWVVGQIYDISLDEIKAIKEENQGNPDVIWEKLKELSENSEMRWFGTGRLHVGAANKIDRFKLIRKEITEGRAEFYVMPNTAQLKDSEDSSLADESIGVLILEKNTYPSINLWDGKLTLKRGNYIGEWSVQVASRTSRVTRPVAVAKKAVQVKMNKANMSSEEISEMKKKIEEQRKQYEEQKKQLKAELEGVKKELKTTESAGAEIKPRKGFWSRLWFWRN